MSLFADAMQPLIIPGMHDTKGPYESLSLSDLLISPKAAFSVTFRSNKKEIDTNFTDPEYIKYVIASDCRRLAVSCLQSVNFLWLEENEKIALPWALIKLYYSAFYAGHVIVRLMGNGCCWLDSSHTKKIAEIGRIYNDNENLPFNFDSGAYQCLVTNNAQTLTWRKTREKGTHESLWAILDEVIKHASEKILQGQMQTADSQQVFQKLDTFRQIAVDKRSTSWLSRTRNELQYRMEHGVWHSTKLSKTDRMQLKGLTDQWRRDPMDIELLSGNKYGILGQFTVTCSFIIAAFRALIINLEILSAGGKGNFVRHGPRTFTNDFKLQI